MTASSSDPNDKPERTIRLSMVEPRGNHNKVWIGSIYADGRLVTQYGRVGYAMQTRTKQCGDVSRANQELERLRAGKIRKGYTEPPIEADAGAEIDLAALPIHIQEQFAAIAHLAEEIEAQTSITWKPNQGIFASQVGPVGWNTLRQARSYLSRIQSLHRTDTRNYAGASFADLAAQYLKLIPLNAVGMQLNATKLERILGNEDKVRAQNLLLQRLEDCLNHVDSLKEEIARALKSQQSWASQTRAAWVDWGNAETTVTTEMLAADASRADAIQW